MATKKQKSRGFLIAFEGGEGGGKSTQRKRLIASLKKRGFQVVLTQEPGGTAIGAKIRGILLNPQHKEMNSRAEVLLYEADRAQNFAERVLPALSQGKIVISDRSMYSSTVYQGICRGLGEKKIDELNAFATFERKPDLVLVLDISAKEGRRRISGRAKLDRLEKENLAFHEKVRQGFLKLARKHKSHFCVVDATLTPDEVFAQIENAVLKRLGPGRA